MAPHFIVCIKAVMLKAPTGKAVRDSETCDLNPMDRPAIEMALQMRDKGGGTVTALSMGPAACAFVLNDAMALGADHGVLLSDPAFAGSDTFATSTILAAAIRRLSPFDLVFFGARTSDSDTGQVGPQTAVLLDLPLVTGAFSMERIDHGFLILRRSDGFQETYRVTPPGAVTIHPMSVQPRDSALGSIGAAYDAGGVEVWGAKDLGLSPESVGEKGSPTRVLSLKHVRRERKCEFLEGKPDEQAEILIQRLRKSGLIG
jgi:electron transfer flavoprotein beta subunit